MYPNYTREIAKQCVGPGWGKLIDKFYDVKEQIAPSIVVQQVKEKFGGIRIYIGFGEDIEDEDVSSSYEELLGIIDELEQESYKTCEACGAFGQMAKRYGWYKTLCVECAEKDDYQIVKQVPTVIKYQKGDVDEKTN